MDLLKCLAMSAIGIASSVSFVARSNDNGGNAPMVGGGTVNPSTVFTSGVPKKVGSMDITTNAGGLVSKITDEDHVVRFGYAQSRAEIQADVLMNVTTEFDNDEFGNDLYFISLNSCGYAVYVKCLSQRDDDNGLKVYCFETRIDYNADNQISKLRMSDDKSKVTADFGYSGGNITNVKYMVDGDTGIVTTSYGSSPIVNKGGLLWLDMYGVENTYLKYIYYAGMLGKGTKSLPQRSEDIFDGEKNIHTCNWTVGADGLPIKMIATDIYQRWSPKPKAFDFEW